MRILWITPGFAADEHDYNCIPPMQLLAKELLWRDVDLQIVALEYPFRSKPYRWHEATVFPCNGQNRLWLKPRTLWRAMRFCQAITFRKFRTTDVSAIHSFWLGWASGVGEKVSARRGIPHFTTLMGQDVLPENRKFLRSLSPERAARLVAVSEFQNSIFEKNTGLRAAYVIPWGVNGAEIPSVLPAERPLDVLGVGSLLSVKNWEKWLRVIAATIHTFPNLRAELIGGGPERAKLEQLAHKLGLSKNVRFVGDLPRPEVLARMRNAKILLHTADFESFGYVLAEAAGAGCRVVSTLVGIAPEMGAVAENVEDLARLVVEGLQQPVEEHSFAPFTMKNTTEAYLRLYF